jgi:hypothetical protein
VESGISSEKLGRIRINPIFLVVHRTLNGWKRGHIHLNRAQGRIFQPENKKAPADLPRERIFCIRRPATPVTSATSQRAGINAICHTSYQAVVSG